MTSERKDNFDKIKLNAKGHSDPYITDFEDLTAHIYIWAQVRKINTIWKYRKGG